MNTIVYNYTCPKCELPSFFTYTSTCPNFLPDGSICGFRLQQRIEDYNSDGRKKIRKHTTEPTGTFSGDISFNTSTGFYLDCKRQALESGDLYLDPEKSYLYAYVTPSGDSSIAAVYHGSSANQSTVSGYLLPLNSKIENLHGKFDNLNGQSVFVARGEDIEIKEAPDGSKCYSVFQSGKQQLFWDQLAATGWVGESAYSRCAGSTPCCSSFGSYTPQSNSSVPFSAPQLSFTTDLSGSLTLGTSASLNDDKDPEEEPAANVGPEDGDQGEVV